MRGIFAAILLLSLTSAAQAWTKAGHMVVGAIAYEVLKKDDPAALARAVAVLKAHPQYDRLWKKDVEKIGEDDRDLYLFMLAGRWADDIRGTEDYDHPTWHYTNGYYKPPGTPDTVMIPTEPNGDALTAYDDNLAKLRSTASDEDKAVPLCWVSHLVGDIHMPLHTVSLFSEQYPEGDRGGNRFFIRAKPDGKALNLHFFWDDLIIGTDAFRECKSRAIGLRLRPEFAPIQLTELFETRFEFWAKAESFELAKKYAYLEGKLKAGKGDLDAELLPEGYIADAKAIAERRGVLAGRRLAAVIKASFAAKP